MARQKGRWSSSGPKRDVSAIPEESSQMSEAASNEQADEDDEEESRSDATTHTTSISSPGSSNRTTSSSRLENGDPIPRLAVGVYQTARTPLPTVSDLAAREAAAVAAGAALSIEPLPGAATPVAYENEMRGPPPHWMPPRPPSSGDPMLPHRTTMSPRYEDEEENYEDPESFPNRKEFSPFGSLRRTPGNSYEISASQQRRSMMRDSTLQTTLSDEDFYLNQQPLILAKNEAGAYFIPPGTLSHGGSRSSPHTARYHDERCLPSSSLMMADQGTALLHPSNKRRNSRVMVGGTPLPSTTIPPLSGSLKKRPPSRRSESSLKDLWRPTPTVLCLLFCLLLAVGLIVVLLYEKLTNILRESKEYNINFSPQPTMHSLPSRLWLGERIYVELVNEEDTELHIPHPMRVTLNASVNPGSKMAIIGKYAAPPTMADHDFLWKLRNGEPVEPSYDMPIDNAMIGTRARRNTENGEEEELGRHSLVFEKFMMPGIWYLRFVNDVKDRPEPLTFVLNSPSSSSDSSLCEGGCGGKGECVGGVCLCEETYGGKNCEIPRCPVTCSGKGVIVNGKCVCEPGFKGADCSLLSSWCESPDCNGHGTCSLEGRCICHRGWTGRDCNETACPHPSCNGHGVCSQGRCFCDTLYEGVGCERLRVNRSEKERGSEERRKKEKEKEEERHVKISMREETPAPQTTVPPASTGSIDIFSSTSSESCTNHGRLTGEGLCECERGWTGEDCETATCSPACLHGECREGKCECLPGFKGVACGRRECPEGCEDHGTCGDDGKCTCNKGWNGANCYQEGCGNGCGGKGECRLKSSGDWACHCEWPFTGRDCEVARESECADGIDNDGDGLSDCDDPDCCDACSGKQQCTTVPSPRESKRGEEQQEGFMRYLRFASKDKSATLGYVTKPFDKSLISVIRGRLVYRHRLTGTTLPLRGARVSQVGGQLNGFTLTRNDTEEGDGIFDIIVNGGRAVELQFLRTPFSQLRKSFFVLPNQIVHVGDVFMDESDKHPSFSPSCSLDRIPPTPETVSSAESADGPLFDRSISDPLPYPRIVADSRTIADQLPIRGTSLSLVYDSTRVSGAELSMRLTDETVDSALRLVHVHVEIAGRRQEVTLAAKRMLRYSWTWNGLDAYGEKMEGRVTASVRIGYEWEGCREISWVDRRVPLDSSNGRKEEMGRGWTIDRLHAFHPQNEVLDRGDGARIQLADQSRWEANTVIGTGEKRTGPCTNDAECNGAAREMRLANPTAVATGLDGSIYVVDHELIRKISPDGLTRTVMTMKSVPSSGDIGTPQLAVDPRDGSLHVVIPVRYQILRVAPKGGPLNAEKRTAVLQAGMNEQQVIAGTGDQCLDENCGDEGEAREARLKNPKAIAFDSQGRLYVADDNRVRVIDAFDPKATRRIRTIGDRSSYKASGPLPCPLSALSSPLAERPLKTLRMQWPTSISIDQSTDSVYVVDASSVVYAIKGEQFSIRRGVPPSCSSSSNSSSAKPIQVAAAPDGAIYLLEHTERGEGKQILYIPYAGHRGEVFAGGPSTMTTTASGECSSSSSSSLPRSRLRVSEVVSMAVDTTRGGSVVVADAVAAMIRRVGPKRLQLDSTTKLFRVAEPEMNEVYFFSETGLHHSTVDLLTGRTLANFTYEGEGSAARLSSIDEGSEKVKITRDEEMITIDNGRGVETRLEMTNGDLKRVATEGYAPISFVYSKEGMMVERGVEGRGRIFLQYSPQGGTLAEMVMEGGERVEVQERQGGKGDYISIRAKRGASINSDHRFYLEDQASIRMDQDASHSFRLIPLGWAGAHLSQPSLGRSDLFDASSIGGGTDTVANALIRARPEDTVDKVITVRKTSLKAVEGRPALSSRLEWSTSSSRSKITKAISHVTRTAKINGAPLLSIRFDHESVSDTYIGPQSEHFLKIRYNEKGQMISMAAEVDVLVESERRLPMMEMVYDSSSLPSLRKWGVRQEEIKRDSSGRPLRRTWSTNESEGVREWRAKYAEDWPTSIISYSGQEYDMEYLKGGEMDEVSSGEQKSTFERLALLDGGELRKRTWQWAEQPFSVIVDRSLSSSDLSSPLNLGLSIEESGLSIREWRSADGERHVGVERDEGGRVRRVRNGEETTSIRYESSGEGAIRQIRSPSVLETFSWQSGLPIQHKIATKASNTESWQESIFDVHYDDLWRVTRVEAAINGHAKESLDLVFDQRTTQLKTVGGFSLYQQPANTTAEKVKLVITRLASATRRPWKTTVKVGETVAEVKISRDAFDRPTLSEWSVKRGEGEERKWQSSMEYDGMGRLVKMARGEKEERRWKLSYDSLGRLSTMGNESIEWAENGMMERRGSEEYEGDANGWIEKKGSLLLDFDSLGRLIGVQSKKAKRSWTVDYDGYGRVVVLRDGSTLYNLFYALPERKELLTHFTRKGSSSSSRLFHLFYSADSSLPFAMREGKKEWALVHDEMDQLTMVVGEEGVEREVVYSPFGDVISDSNPSLFVPCGSFRGGIPLPETGIVILRDGNIARPWDARAGRFLSFPPSVLLPSTRDLLRDPSIALHPMAIKDCDLPWAAAEIPDDLSSWLHLVGAPSALLTRLDTVVSRSIGSPLLTSRRLARLDARLTWLKGDQSVRQTRLHDEDAQLEWSSDEDSWAGLLQIVVDEKNRTESIHFSSVLSTEERLSLHRLLSESTVVGGSERRLKEDGVQEIHVAHREDHLPADVQSSSHAHFSIHRGQDSIEVKRGTTKIVAHYGKEAYSTTSDGLRDEARRKWDASVWRAEKRRVESGRRSVRNWTPAERKQLIEKGTVAGYSIRLKGNTVNALPSIYSWEFVK
ncbi:hypothetical protein PMAYCL1PPCAC_12999, partial [Pristionchus mayeri]